VIKFVGLETPIAKFIFFKSKLFGNPVDAIPRTAVINHHELLPEKKKNKNLQSENNK